MVDIHIGKNCSPLLDIIAWNIQRTTNDIITFTKNWINYLIIMTRQLRQELLSMLLSLLSHSVIN